MLVIFAMVSKGQWGWGQVLNYHICYISIPAPHLSPWRCRAEGVRGFKA